LVSAAWRVIISVGSVGRSPDSGSADAYRHSAAYGCATVNTATVDTAAMDAGVMNAGAANANAATAICERIG
jgi:hypothetical protein